MIGVWVLELLLLVIESLELVTIAVFKMFVEQKDWLFTTCTVIVRVIEELGARVPMLQETCCPETVQPGAETKMSPAGRESVRETFCAVAVVELF